MKSRPDAPWATTTKPPTSGVKKSCLNCDFFIPNNQNQPGGLCVAAGQKGMKISSRHLSPCKLYEPKKGTRVNCVNCSHYKCVRSDSFEIVEYVYKCFHPSHGIAKLMPKPISNCPSFNHYR